MMSNKTYNIIKAIAQLILPALAALYASLAGIWGWPYAEAIVGSISAVDVFLGVLLKVKSDIFWRHNEIIEWDGVDYEDNN